MAFLFFINHTAPKISPKIFEGEEEEVRTSVPLITGFHNINHFLFSFTTADWFGTAKVQEE